MKNWEIVKACEEGREVEFRKVDSTEGWSRKTMNPGWWGFRENEYRVKPEKVRIEVRRDHGFHTSIDYMAIPEDVLLDLRDKYGVEL